MKQIAWHYTIWHQRAEYILRDGIIRPAVAFVPDHESPIVWFSTNQHWEPTANKRLIDTALGKERGLTMRETVELGGGGWRFGLHTSTLLYYRQLIRVARIKRKTTRGLEMTAKESGADPTRWWGFVGPVKVADCIVQHLEGGTWTAAE
jgi:hypothetical protein